jgi:hypothetical protein
MTYNLNKNLTTDKELLADTEYQACLTAIEMLRISGMMQHVAGNCIATSELFQHTLREVGISSRMVECKLIISIVNSGTGKELRYLGFNGIDTTAGYVDTHVVLITETKIPMLIDLSIAHLLTGERLWVMERVVSNDPDIISKITFKDSTLTYSVKKSPRLLGLHQTTLLERISQEQQTKKNISFMKKIIIAIGIFTLVNFTLNTSMLTLKYIEINNSQSTK